MGDTLIVIEDGAARDAEIAIAIFDTDGNACVALQILPLDAAERGIHHDHLIAQGKPHDAEMRCAIFVDGRKNGETLLVEEITNVGIERHENGNTLSSGSSCCTAR